MDVATWGIDVVVVWVLRIRFNDSAADEYNLNVVAAGGKRKMVFRGLPREFFFDLEQGRGSVHCA